MKQLRIFILVSCFFVVLYSLIVFFPDISIAKETPRQKCISSCDSNRQVCFNINADKRLCEVEYQDCIAACKPEDDSSSTATPAEQEPKSIAPSKAMEPK
jgi:hypothetical protein